MVKEFTKISPHNHIGGSKADRKIDENYNKELSFSIEDVINTFEDAKENGFELLAMTNSNVFKVSYYLQAKLLAKKYGINLLPGIEINYSNKNHTSYLHIILIFDPTANLLDIQKNIDEFMEKNKKNYLVIDQIVEILLKAKTILIPHGIKQYSNKTGKDRSMVSNIEQDKELISMADAIPIAIEDNKSYHRQTLKTKLENKLSKEEYKWLDEVASVSSADRSSFSEIKSPTYIWGDKTFNDLYFSVLMKKSRIKRDTDIIEKSSYISKIVIQKKSNKITSQIKECEIICSHGLNSIIGRSGSGKTLLLNAIKKELTSENLKSKISSLSYYEEVYKDVDIKLYDSNGNLIEDKSKWKAFEGDNLYNQILKAYTSDKNELIEELNLNIDDTAFRNKINIFLESANKYISDMYEISKLKNEINLLIGSLVSNIEFLKNNKTVDESITYLISSDIDEKLEKSRKNLNINIVDYKQMIKATDEIKRLLDTYDSKEYSNTIYEINTILKEKICKKYKENRIELIRLRREKSKKIHIFEIVNKYNRKLGNKINTINKKLQENINNIYYIEKYISELMLLKRNIKIPIISIDTKNEPVLKINDSKFANLIINKINFNIERDNLAKIFNNCIGPAKNKINLTKFKKKSYNLSKKDNVKEFLQEFIDNNYLNPITMDFDYNSYINFELQIKNSNNHYENIENMSAGELSKTYVNNLLDKKIEKIKSSNLILLFDQPDVSLEKKFILDELSTKLDELRNHYQIFITTHEPLLVVNADSNNIIKAANNKTATSKKNKIEYCNLSFVDKYNSKENMVNAIAELVDGSYSAVKDRSEIYGGMLNENINK